MSHEMKLQEAKVAIGRGRNRVDALVPINSLPSEILTRIFQLACDNYRGLLCQRGQVHIRNFIPKHPDIFLHICSWWRHIALSSSELWSHIDLALRHHRMSRRLLDRAVLYLGRSGSSKLSICIVEPYCYALWPPIPDEETFNTNLFRFLPSAAARMSSLRVEMGHELTNFHAMILTLCFSYATPGVFTRLSTGDDSYLERANYHFFQAAAHPHSNGSLPLETSHRSLEDILKPVTALNLRGLYPHWTSSAYQGLTELHLTTIGPDPPMTELQFTRILKASPQLRELYLHDILFTAPNQNPPTSIAPVKLDHLKTLVLTMEDPSTLENILPLLAPGRNPLDVHISLPELASELPSSLKKAAQAFFDRSNITRLKIDALDCHIWLMELLSSCPDLQRLVVERLMYPLTPGEIIASENEITIAPRRLEGVHIIRSTVALEGVRHMLARIPTQSLTLERTTVYHNGRIVSHKQTIKDVLAPICPVIEMQ